MSKANKKLHVLDVTVPNYISLLNTKNAPSVTLKERQFKGYARCLIYKKLLFIIIIQIILTIVVKIRTTVIVFVAKPVVVSPSSNTTIQGNRH